MKKEFSATPCLFAVIRGYSRLTYFSRFTVMVAIYLAAFISQARAASGTSSWTTLFPGIEHATGWSDGTGGDPVLAVNCLRIDLTNPNIELMATSHLPGSSETIAQTTGGFLMEYDVQVAINVNSASSSGGGNDEPYLANPSGALVSHGTVSSPEDMWSHDWRIDRDNNVTLCLQPDLDWPNNPGTPLIDSSVWTAIAGYNHILSNGIVAYASTNPGEDPQHQYDRHPRTATGLSLDGNTFYMMTVDGRQPGVSDGVNLHDLAEWIQTFGAYNALNHDGGGCTTMAKDNGAGGYDLVNVPTGPGGYTPGAERFNGANFGIRSLTPGARVWNAASGNWADGSNWDTGTIPYKVDDVTIANGGTVQITQAGSCKGLILDNGILEVIGGQGTMLTEGAMLTVETYDQAANGTLIAQIDADGISLINVVGANGSGEANLAGTFTLIDSGAVGISYTLLTAESGIFGAFDTVDLPAGWSLEIGVNNLSITRPAIALALEDGSFEDVTTGNWGFLPTSGTGWIADEVDVSFAAKSSSYNPGYSSAYPLPTPAGAYFCDLHSSSIHQALVGQTYVEGNAYILTYWAAAGTKRYDQSLQAYFTDGDVAGGAYSGTEIATELVYFHEDAVWREYSTGHIATAADHGKTIGIAVKGGWYTHVDDVSVSYVPAGDGPDGDGLPYWWEMQYYGGATNANPSATCANGDNTVMEAYIAGFDPTDPLAGFGVVEFLAGDPGHNIINWDEAAGRIYTVYWTTNLMDGFTTVLTNNYAEGSFTDTVHYAESEGFYKLEVEVAP